MCPPTYHRINPNPSAVHIATNEQLLRLQQSNNFSFKQTENSTTPQGTGNPHSFRLSGFRAYPELSSAEHEYNAPSLDGGADRRR